jgi:XTP/dITP diphosphohydrolase
VAEGIVAKLIRRHPHVFADVTVSGPEEVKRNWDAIKAAERAEAAGAPVSVLDTVPFGQPALSLAAQLQRRAERAGVPADLAGPPPGDPASTGRARTAGDAPAGGGFAGTGGPAGGDGAAGGAATGEGDGAPGGQAVSDIGAELFALVARAREAGLDPELELRAAARAYRDRVRAWERSERG